MSLRLEMSIGPVQGFIQQSRRTRDLWGSSYLLAFLAAHAAHGVRKAGGKIVHPLVDEDPLFRWVGGQREGEPPQTGSLPNHFSAEVNEADAHQVARAGVAASRHAWTAVCDAVWRRFVEPCASMGAGTQEIWRRQTQSFWEVTWVVGPHSSTGVLPPMARRKYWRSHRLPDEPGDKCTVMPALQELSGHLAAPRGRAAQKSFWTAVRSRAGELNVRSNERMSSVAFVKRMFPETGARALGWSVDPHRWPSTRDIAERGQPEARLSDGGEPPVFHAVVVADGDRLGWLARQMDDGGVSRALARFTRRIDDVVCRHHGVTVYAGGDDVLALLPVHSALRCAEAMATLYGDMFAGETTDQALLRRATLSAGVAFAHVAVPLGGVIREARRLLDDVAKNGNGRDSLAVAVLKPGGLHSEWVTTWRRNEITGESTAAVEAVMSLTNHLAAHESEPGVSSSLLYRLPKMLSRLSGGGPWEPGSWGELSPELDLPALVRAELAQSLSARSDAAADHGDRLAAHILSLLPRARRNEADRPNIEIGFDGLMIARFLATGGRQT